MLRCYVVVLLSRDVVRVVANRVVVLIAVVVVVVLVDVDVVVVVALVVDVLRCLCSLPIAFKSLLRFVVVVVAIIVVTLLRCCVVVARCRCCDWRCVGCCDLCW